MSSIASVTGTPGPRVCLALAALVALAFVTRAAGLGQPIVENYVGRQVPTAMVARNLERDREFLRPKIDVAPLPNLFLVEPPVFAGLAVVLKQLGRLPLEAAGRLVSALGVAIGAWGLFGLTARRDGVNAALTAVAVFLVFPVTIRYGRAFQPDALMLGCLVAGVRCWDDFENDGAVGRLVAGFVLLSLAMALKVISAHALVPLIAVVIRDRKPWKLALAAATLLPAALWYVHAAGLLSAGGGSRASADNGAIWLRTLVPSAWFRVETWGHVARFLGVRAFTPLGPWLAVAGFLIWPRDGDRLWRVWGGASMAALALLAAKLHHEYYWLAVAPVGAVGVARALTGIGSRGTGGKLMAAAAGAGLIGLAGAFSASTWKTPPEWSTLRAAAREVQARVPAGEWVVAPEALLFEADRQGCRLEFTPGAANRAAGEWGDPLGGEGPAALVEFYRRKGARFFADVRPGSVDAGRRALHEAVRNRYNVLVDRPGVLIARLNEPRNEDTPHARGPDRDTYASGRGNGP
jgi:hypothetical protein